MLFQAEREEHLRVQRQADAYSPDELGEVLDKYDAKSPLKNPLTKPFPFNLMFKVSKAAFPFCSWSLLFAATTVRSSTYVSDAAVVCLDVSCKIL